MSVVTRVLAVAIASAMTNAAVAYAQPEPRPTPAPPLRPPARPAMVRVAEAVAATLADVPPHALVVAAPLVTDTPAPRAAALVALASAEIASKLGRGAHARADAATLAAAREQAKADGALVYVGVEIALGKVRVTADAYPTPRTVWARIRDPEPPAIAHAFAEAPLDAEIRAHLAPIPLTAANVTRAKNFESDVVALACGDVEGDGGLEIVSVSRRRVTTLRLRAGKVFPIASRAWPDLAPVSPTPLREAIGFATLLPREGGGAFIDVGLSDRAKSVRLDGKLAVVTSFAGLAVPDGEGSACARLSSSLLSGLLTPCAHGDAAPRGAVVGGKFDAFASAWLTSPRGEPSFIWAGREAGQIGLRDDAGHRQSFDGAGAQVAVGDLDEDGEPEVIHGLDVANALEDAVVVRAWKRSAVKPAEALVELYRLPAAAGVHAVAVCPPDGGGRAPFVVATADEIWVVR